MCTHFKYLYNKSDSEFHTWYNQNNFVFSENKKASIFKCRIIVFHHKVLRTVYNNNVVKNIE